MTYEELTAEIIRFANYVPGSSTKAFDYLFSAGDINALYEDYTEAVENSKQELMQEIAEHITCIVRKYCGA